MFLFASFDPNHRFAPGPKRHFSAYWHRFIAQNISSAAPFSAILRRLILNAPHM